MCVSFTGANYMYLVIKVCVSLCTNDSTAFCIKKLWLHNHRLQYMNRLKLVQIIGSSASLTCLQLIYNLLGRVGWRVILLLLANWENAHMSEKVEQTTTRTAETYKQMWADWVCCCDAMAFSSCITLLLQWRSTSRYPTYSWKFRSGDIQV